MKRSTIFAAGLLLLGATLHLRAQEPQVPADTEMKTTESGLSYCVLTPGTGTTKPTSRDTVTVHYSGWLEDGKLFDSSVKSGKPATFGVTGVIKGWTEALQLMTVGARWKLKIPPALGYGDKASARIPAGSTLIFEVELLDIVSPPAYQPIDAEKATALPSGIKYVIDKEGAGEAIGPDDGAELYWSFWNAKGEDIDWWKAGKIAGGRPFPFKGSSKSMPLEFLKQVLPLMKKGTVMRLEVPPALAFKSQPLGQLLAPDSVTIWQLECMQVFKSPVAFSKPDPAKMTKTASGLMYEVLKEGSGAKLKGTNEQVTAHYAGWLEDGTLFDSSYHRGEPMQIAANQVIKGWQEGLLLMKEGDTYRFLIPGDLAYGPKPPPGGTIPPNATLIFVVELIKIGR